MLNNNVICASYQGRIYGGALAPAPPPFKAEKNYERAKLIVSGKSAGSLILFTSIDVRMVAAVYFALHGGGG